jgi:hypothetical protein
LRERHVAGGEHAQEQHIVFELVVVEQCAVFIEQRGVFVEHFGVFVEQRAADWRGFGLGLRECRWRRRRRRGPPGDVPSDPRGESVGPQRYL